MDKQLVTVMRKWHEPFIRIDITTVGVGITMSLEDFVVALAREAKINERLAVDSAELVVKAMKQETSKAL